MFLKFLDGGNCPVAFDMIVSLGPKRLAGFCVFLQSLGLEVWNKSRFWRLRPRYHT